MCVNVCLMCRKGSNYEETKMDRVGGEQKGERVDAEEAPTPREHTQSEASFSVSAF